jgi:hypothetical protein
MFNKFLNFILQIQELLLPIIIMINLLYKSIIYLVTKYEYLF